MTSKSLTFGLIISAAILSTPVLFPKLVLADPTVNPDLSCKVRTYIVDNLYRLPYKYDTMQAAYGSLINLGTSIIYTFDIQTNNSERKTLQKVTAIQQVGYSEPIAVKQVFPPNGTCTVSSSTKEIVCNLNYSFSESASGPIEYLFQITGNPNAYPKTSTLFTIETDHGSTSCASYHSIPKNPPTNEYNVGTPSAVIPIIGTPSGQPIMVPQPIEGQNESDEIRNQKIAELEKRLESTQKQVQVQQNTIIKQQSLIEQLQASIKGVRILVMEIINSLFRSKIL